MLALFAVMLFVVIGMVAIVIDVSWLWANSLKIQRAADAAALAGVIHLPGAPATATTVARAEARKNGYNNGGGVAVSPLQDPRNARRLVVTIQAPVDMFFARLFGIQHVDISRTARAEYALPVPMGSPQSYFGIYQLTAMSGATTQTLPVPRAPNAGGSANLSSQGFWAAVITRGGQRGNGDGYSPQNNGGSANAAYDPAGYDYTIVMPAGTTRGEVSLFDATFCAVGRAPSGSYLGTGDHWIGPGGTPVTTEFRLWDTRNTLWDSGDDVLVVDAGNRFSNENQVDKGPRYTGNGRYSDGGYDGVGSADCQNDPDHNAWYRLATNLRAGTYRLQVTTSSASNVNTNAENMFGIQAASRRPVEARVHGNVRMAMYNNLDGATSLFYLAKIDAVHAGKTMEIRLFDPGDVGGNATLRIKRPTTTGYVDATFSYTADNGRSGNNVTTIQTAINGASQFNNSWLTILVPLPNTYGLGADTLLPPGETETGWWKIQYDISASGNDTTTWEVSIRGNPVHLVTP
ncbi:MAG TPA: pilus assembly protein TadG-related protein [Candidatus Limnocylindrales bacterium]